MKQATRDRIIDFVDRLTWPARNRRAVRRARRAVRRARRARAKHIKRMARR